jgi:hypothetical protein
LRRRLHNERASGGCLFLGRIGLRENPGPRQQGIKPDDGGNSDNGCNCNPDAFHAVSQCEPILFGGDGFRNRKPIIVGVMHGYKMQGVIAAHASLLAQE